MATFHWKSWSAAHERADLIDHPQIQRVARSLVVLKPFMDWLSSEQLIILPLGPASMIVASALCRMRSRYGMFDRRPVAVPAGGQLDEEVGVPGLSTALWAAGWIQMDGEHQLMQAPRGSFPGPLDDFRTQTEEQKDRNRLRKKWLARLKALKAKGSP